MTRTPIRAPSEQPELHGPARKLEWITIAYLLSAATLLALVMGSSQALKTAWIDDAISLVAPIAFLASSPVGFKEPNERFPYGYRRVQTLAFFANAVALCGVGAYLLIDGVATLVEAERVTFVRPVRAVRRRVVA